MRLCRYRVLVNVITNDIQAMSVVNDRLRLLTIRSRLHDDDVLVTIEDKVHRRRMWAEPCPTCGAIFSILFPVQGSTEEATP